MKLHQSTIYFWAFGLENELVQQTKRPITMKVATKIIHNHISDAAEVIRIKVDGIIIENPDFKYRKFEVKVGRSAGLLGKNNI